MDNMRQFIGYSMIYSDAQAYCDGAWMPAGALSCSALNISKEEIAALEEAARADVPTLCEKLAGLECVSMCTDVLPEAQAAGVLDDLICFRVYIRHFLNKYIACAEDTYAAYSRFLSNLDALTAQLRRSDALRRTVLPREFSPKISVICVDGRICERYVFPTLCQLLVYDQLRALRYDKAAKKCGNCGRFFTPDRKNAGYCELPSPDDPTHTCREVGAHKVFVSRHEGSQAYKLCAAACGRIYTRKSRGSLSADDAAALLTRCMALRDKAAAGEITIEQLGAQLSELTMAKKS